MYIDMYLIRAKRLLAYMGLFMILDYILTYIGIHILQCIIEANPFMRNFMELPFIVGLPLRIVYILFPINLLLLAYYYSDNKNSILKIIHGMLLFQFVPLFLHLFWIFQYIQLY
ncbi:hypothetical protein EDC19_1207 [Natranaerovirga hydrolytica]|uniref:DUF5658 domain-containing protein n=1 Tax=Natranaerovirga hydrolytica TaxID=680378 RepID=A0A4R1N1I1_9FIRM|nr:DUF5658 family protein [Natranaerovirga hydrolytica]TCK98772.1 hypothetical protein EDC19_1207 [Natranaerovirga hydrolytica]